MKETKFKDTEIGLIPEDWKVKPLTELCEFRNGYTPSKAVREYWENGTIPWFRMEDIRNNGRILSDSIQHITPVAVKGELFETNSIIMSTTATIGEHALLIADSLANQQFTNLKIRKSQENVMDIMYFYWYCYKLGDWCTANINEGGLAAVNISDFANVPIPLPPTLAEQTRIATALSDIDSLIDSLGKLIQKKRNIKQGAMQELLTGKKRLKGFEKPWVERTIGDVCSLYGRIGFRGYTKADLVAKHHGAITFSPSDINEQVLYYDNCDYISLAKYEESPEIKVYNGDIIFCKTASIGKCAIVKNLQEKATINPQFVVLKDFKCNNIFLYYILAFSDFQERVKSITGGSTILTMSQEKLKAQKILMPSTLEEQNAIARILSDMDKEIEALEAKQEKYKSIKEGMMQELLSGKIRLI